MVPSVSTHEHSDGDGHFRRKPSAFRNFISNEPGSLFPPEKDRYALYINYGCPWAHRTIIVRALKGLEDIVQLITTDFELTEDGWLFTGRNGSLEKDPLYGFTNLKQLYLKADPDYTGRYLVPTLWDKKQHTIVSNESSEIIRMFYTEFDHLLPEPNREANQPGGGFYPERLRSAIDEMNEWVYDTVNNGVYKCGFATSQAAYDTNIYRLFESLDRLECHLSPTNASLNHGGPFLFGPHVTEPDVRLYTTLIRFDAAYHTIFQCNLKSIRHDYPNLYLWLRRLYWDDTERTRHGAFRNSVDFRAYRYGYTRARGRMLLGGDEVLVNKLVVPAGPAIDIDELKVEERI